MTYAKVVLGVFKDEVKSTLVRVEKDFLKAHDILML